MACRKRPEWPAISLINLSVSPAIPNCISNNLGSLAMQKAIYTYLAIFPNRREQSAS